MSDLIKQCDECKLNECINCEHSWADIQELKQQLAEKDKEIVTYKEVLETYKEKPVNVYQMEIRNLQVDKAELKLKLEEKDKEIEELNSYIDHQLSPVLYRLISDERDVRHQICEEIREKLLMLCDWYEDEIDGYWYATAKKINYVLDQVEKGERK